MEEQRERIKALFDAHDSDGNGVLSFEEMSLVMTQLGMEDEDCRTLFDEADWDMNGVLDVDEFLGFLFWTEENAEVPVSLQVAVLEAGGVAELEAELEAQEGPGSEARQNDEGAPVKCGTSSGWGDFTDRFYCGRHLGPDAIPGSDGGCGPSAGPQCASCKRFQNQAFAFLPLEINGVRVLVEEEANVWRVTNEQLKNTTAGLGYRRSKNLDDKYGNIWIGHIWGLAKWNVLIKGVDQGDGWVLITNEAAPPPYPGYLSGYASDEGEAHQSLEAATAACLSDPTAGGITKEGDNYTVRAGTELIASPSGEVSWLKSDLAEQCPKSDTEAVKVNLGPDPSLKGERRVDPSMTFDLGEDGDTWEYFSAIDRRIPTWPHTGSPADVLQYWQKDMKVVVQQALPSRLSDCPRCASNDWDAAIKPDSGYCDLCIAHKRPRADRLQQCRKCTYDLCRGCLARGQWFRLQYKETLKITTDDAYADGLPGKSCINGEAVAPTKWGELLQGVDQGDGWVKVDDMLMQSILGPCEDEVMIPVDPPIFIGEAKASGWAEVGDKVWVTSLGLTGSSHVEGMLRSRINKEGCVKVQICGQVSAMYSGDGFDWVDPKREVMPARISWQDGLDWGCEQRCPHLYR